MTTRPAPLVVHACERIIKWGECDFAGIAYTPRYADWCIELLEEFYRDIGVPWQRLHSKMGLGSPFVKLHIDFKSPLQVGDALRQSLAVDQVGSSSIRWLVTGRVGDREIYSASVVNVVINKATGRSASIPPALRDKLQQLQAATKETNDEPR